MPRYADRRQAVVVVDGGVVVTATGVEDPLAEAEGVGDVEAGRAGGAVQVHAVVVGCSAVVDLAAVGEGGDAGDGEAVGVEVAPLRGLDEGEAAMRPSPRRRRACCARCARRVRRVTP